MSDITVVMGIVSNVWCEIEHTFMNTYTLMKHRTQKACSHVSQDWKRYLRIIRLLIII